VAFFKRLVKRQRDGTYTHSFPAHIPELLVGLGDQLDAALDEDSPELRRLFPTAYPNDKEKDDGYQIFARDELIEGRREAIRSVRRTANQEVLTEEELGAWLALANDLRLVLGTRLDVSEDDDLVRWDDPENDDPEMALRRIYEVLGHVVGELVDGLSSGLAD